MAIALSGAGAAELIVANRSRARARDLAQRLGGRAISLDELPDELVGADVLLASTGAPGVLIERSDMEEVMERRDGRALLVVDVAVPRDVDPGVSQVFGITLLDIDDLRAFGDQSLQARRAEVGKVREIITDELERFRLEQSARVVSPLVAALRARAEDVRNAEMSRQASRLAALDPTTRAAVEQVTRGLVNKLLHEPTIRLKESAGSPRGELLADALADLFALDETPLNDDLE
jgi:glutamyl-tRNA reductase